MRNNTHDWCNDKPYEWDLETLEGKTFVATNRQDFFFVQRALTHLYCFSQGEEGRCKELD